MVDVPESWSAHERNKPIGVTDYQKHKITADKASHLPYIILFKESQQNRGRNSLGTSLSSLL
jgi:hypothetical protein